MTSTPTQTASSAIDLRLVPDSWPNLARMRQLIFEKNRVFEERRPRTLDVMIGINAEIDGLIANAVEDLKRPPAFLPDVQRSILRCHEIESKAFEKLSADIMY